MNSYTKNKIDVIGKFEAKVKFKSECCTAVFNVVKSGVSLIGKNLIKKLNLTIHGGTLSVDKVSSKPSMNPGTTNTDHCDVTKQYPQLFSSDFGHIKGFKHRIKLKSDVKPVQSKLRKLPLAVRSSVSKELRRLQEADIIEQVDEASEWISPTVVVAKQSGDIRLCVDLRNVNTAIIVDTYPLPDIEEIFMEFDGAKCFSRLDLKSAFNQMELDEESRHLTTFITHDGLFRYKRVCFGLASAPSCFQRMMSSILHGIPGVTCFIDDIVVYGKTRQDHDTNLRMVLQKLNDVGMKLNNKCEFYVDSLQVLGHTIDKDGVHPLPSKVDSIVNAPVPESKDQVKSFLGLAGYYAKFISNFASKVIPIRQVQDSSPFQWTNSADTAFKQIKEEILNSPALSVYNLSLPTRVTADSSGYGIGATLAQIKDGVEVLVSCASRKLTPSEQKYSTGEREALACLWAIERWHTYLWGREFELVTDHKPLITLLSSFGTGHQPMRIARWSARLLNYNYTVKYKPGEENAVADALSRLPVEVTEDSCYPDAREEFGSVCNIVFDESGISKSDFSESCTSDEVYTSVANYIVKGWPVDQHHIEKNLLPYYRIREELSLHEDIIFRGDRVVVPTDLQCGLVDKAHEAHQGIVRTKQRLRQLYWFPKKYRRKLNIVLSVRLMIKQPLPELLLCSLYHCLVNHGKSWV